MGAKFSYVAAAHRRLQFASQKKKKNANAVALEAAALEFSRAMARIMTPAQMFQQIDIDEGSLIERWEILRFLKREAGMMQQQTTAAMQGQSGLAEQVQLQASEFMYKIKQIWLRLDKPTSLPLNTFHDTNTSATAGGAPVTSVDTKRPTTTTATATAGQLTSPNNSTTITPATTSTTIPALNLSKLNHASTVTSVAASSIDLLGRDSSTALTREELIQLFRDFTNEDIDFLLKSSLARSKIIHPTLPKASLLNSRPSMTQPRFKDLFRWLFDSLDTTRRGTLTGAEIKSWLIGPSPSVGGRSTRNELLIKKPNAHIGSQVRIITNKLEDTQLYTKPEFEYMFLRWSYDDLVEISNDLRLSEMAAVAEFQVSVREFHALTRRVDTIALATARLTERSEEKRRQVVTAPTTTHSPPPAHTHHGHGHGHHGRNGSTSAPPVPDPSQLLASATNLDALSAGIQALLSDKDRRALEDNDRERREQQRASELKRKEEKETREIEERKRRLLSEAEIGRSEERMKIVERDLVRDDQLTEKSRLEYVRALEALWTKHDGRFGPAELETLFRYQEQYHISRRMAVEIFQQLQIPVERINSQIIATIPDLEPLCVNCLLHSSNHMTRECGHMCYCDSCASEMMALPPHVRTCLTCKRPVSQLIKCVYQHWTR